MKNFYLRAALVLVAMGLSLSAFAQMQVSGTVMDAALGEPIIGANIVEKGTTNGTITDFDGNFVITVQSNAILQISYIGYKTLELPAKTVMKVEMREDTEVLEDVVVVGYGTVKKNDATGSVTAIKPDGMNKGMTTNAQDMLSGKIAGVQVSTDGGTPGGGATIRIRGGSSLRASNDPLIVIDGLAMDNKGVQGVANPLSMINPNDIETFTVLKDASATAIYGSRASNGVIIITTKKGASGSKLKVSYDGNVSFGTLTKRMGTLTGDELRAYAAACGLSEDGYNFVMMENTDWQDQVYRTAVSTDHNVSLTGGYKDKNVDMPYRASIGYTLNNGVIKTSQMQRVTANLNLSPSFLDKHLMLNLNAKGMYIYNSYEPGVAGTALSTSPTIPIYSNGNLLNANGTQVVSKDELDTHWGGYFQPTETLTSETGPYNDRSWLYQQKNYTSANPVAMLNQQSNTANSGAFIGNLEATYRVHGLEDLVLHANFGADYSYGKQTQSNSIYGTANHYYGWNGYQEKHKYNLQFNCYAQWGHDWEEARQHFDIMAGYEWQHFYDDYVNRGNGLYQLTNEDPTLAGQIANPYSSEYKTENYLVSFFGRLNYVGWNQLMITATVRGDGSSRFAKGNKWGVFPSVALGWKIKETFMPDQNICNDLKLRLGWGMTGQQDGIGDYSYMPTYTISKGHQAYYPVGFDNYAMEDKDGNMVEKVVDANDNELYINDRPNGFNPDLTWEKTTTYNVGIDYGFLNNRITGSIDYYYRKTTDLLNDVIVAAGTNFRKKVTTNVGSLSNQGLEFAINAIILDYGKKFKWDFGYNLTYNVNKVLKLNNGSEQTAINGGGYGGTGNGGKSLNKIAVGYATNTFYLYDVKKGSRADGSQYWYVVDQDKNGKIDEHDRIMEKNPVAPVSMGFQMKFQFYGFDLGMSFRANIGNYVYNNVKATKLNDINIGSMTRGGYLAGTMTTVFNAFYKDGFTGTICNADGTPNPTFTEYDLTNYFLENASFLRCDNITLGYSFTTKNEKLSGRAFCTISNPFVISKYSGLDPEVGINGVDNSIYPRCMTTILGINLQF